MAAPDLYHWARDSGLYISQDALVGLMNEGGVLICDTRDDDNAGGHITGAVHCPDSSFDATAVAHLASTRGSGTIVFHCMESARRGPRCAHRLFCHFNPDRSDAVPEQRQALTASPGIDGIPPKLDRDGQPKIRVLIGGADKWIRRFFRDPTKVENFDDEYWGFLPEGQQWEGTTSTSNVEEGSGSAVCTARKKTQHMLYRRPADQPATPWSEAGDTSTSAGTL